MMIDDLTGQIFDAAMKTIAARQFNTARLSEGISRFVKGNIGYRRLGIVLA